MADFYEFELNQKLTNEKINNLELYKSIFEFTPVKLEDIFVKYINEKERKKIRRKKNEN